MIVGSWSVLRGNFRFSFPVMWTEDTGLQRIDLMAQELGLDLSGWTLLDVFDVSDDGRTIVGRGSNPAGFGEAWVLHLDSIPDIVNVPEPATRLLLAAGLAGLAAKRRPI